MCTQLIAFLSAVKNEKFSFHLILITTKFRAIAFGNSFRLPITSLCIEGTNFRTQIPRTFCKEERGKRCLRYGVRHFYTPIYTEYEFCGDRSCHKVPQQRRVEYAELNLPLGEESGRW